ncbi:MAG TPA: HEAT repeat domain-containing protein [Candidatus Binatia bacterium]|nr:HEAT repeat domain-containing protein [Candidatus Binatia bacterium]
MATAARWFRVEEEEKQKVIALCGGGFFAAASVSFFWGLLQAFVLKRAGFAALPSFFVMCATAQLLGSVVSLRFMRRLPPGRQALRFAIFTALAVVVLAVLERAADATSSFGPLFVAGVGALGTNAGLDLVVSKLRATEAEDFNLEQLERLDPMLTGSMTFGLAFGGVLLAALGGRVSVTTLFSLAPLLVLASLPFVLMLSRSSGGAAAELPVDPAAHTAGWRWDPRQLGRSPSLRFVIALATVMAMSAAFTRLFQFAFAAAANARFADESALGGFIGAYTAVLSIVSAVVVNTVHRFALKRYGLSAALDTAPAVITAGVAAMAVWPFFPVVVGSVFTRDILLPLQETAFRGMLDGMRDDLRNAVWTWLDGPILVAGDLSGAFATAALGYIATGSAATAVRATALVILVLLVLRFVANVQVRRRYPEMLLDGLDHGDFKARLRAMEALQEFRFLHERRLGALIDIARNGAEPLALRTQAIRTLGEVRDPSTLRVIARFIDDRDDEVRLEAVRAVSAFRYQPERLYESGFSRYQLITRLKDEFAKETDADITNAILEALIALRDPDIVPFLIAALGNESKTIRLSTLRSLRSFTDPSIIDHVKPFLDDADPAMRAQAVAALWKFPWERAATLSGVVDSLLSPAGSEERRQGLYLVGVLRLDGKKKDALAALKAKDPKTRIVAAVALLKLGDETGVPVLTRALAAGTRDEAWEVERLEHHPNVPRRQRELVRTLVHQHHLHYPAGLPVSEPLRVRLADIPAACLEGLKREYSAQVDAPELRKLGEASGSGTQPRGTAVLVGLPSHWRRMAAVALLANGWLVREASSAADVAESEIPVTTGDETAAGVVLTAKTAGLKTNEVALSHLAPSELVSAMARAGRV